MNAIRSLLITWPGRALAGAAVAVVVVGVVIAPRLGSGAQASGTLSANAVVVGDGVLQLIRQGGTRGASPSPSAP